MAEKDTTAVPTIVEDDGWTLASGSQSRPTEDELRQALGADAVPAAGEPPPPEEPTPAEATDETPAADGTEPPAEEEIAATPATPQPKKRRPHDAQKRIDKMTADLNFERERSQRLERELAARTQPPPQVPRLVPPPLPPARPVAPVLGPKPIWGGENGYEAQGKSWEEYENASQTYTQQMLTVEINTALERRLGEERARAETSQANAAADAAFAARVDALRAKRPDYDTVIEQLGDLDSLALKHLIYHSPEGPAIGLHLAEHVDQARTLASMPFSRPMVDALRRAKAPAQVLQHLALHPKDFENILRVDPITAIIEIGRLDARLNVAPSVTTGAAHSVTSARPPLRTVGGGAPMTRAPQTAGEDLPFGPDYISRENQTEALRRDRSRGY